MPTFQRTPVATAAAAAAASAATTLLLALAGPASAATFTWTSGAFVPGTTAPSPLPAADVLNIQTVAGKSFSGVSFSNGGTVNWQASSGDISFISGASISNGGLWDAQGNAAVVYGGGTASTFTNSGTLRKSAGTGTTLIGNSGSLQFVNSGTIDAQTGTLQFSGGSTFNSGTVFTGAGSVVVTSGSVFSGAIQSANLNLAGGVQTGTNAELSGLAAWQAGTLAGGWTLNTGSTLALQGSGGKTFNGTSFTNKGTVAWQASSGDLALISSASITNTGVWNAQGDAALVYGGGTASTFDNSGTLRKSAGAGTTQIGNSTSVGFTNSGTVDAQTGTIAFGGSQTFNAGTVFTGAGSVVVNTASTFNGGFTASNLTIAAGRQTGGAAVLNGQAQWTGGTLAGGWQVAPGATLNLNGAGVKTFDNASFGNGGTVAWQASSGDLSLISSTSITNTGVWNAQGDAALVYGGGTASTFNNSGTLRKSGGIGNTQIGNSTSVLFVNSGTIDAQSGSITIGGSNIFNPGTVFTGAGSVVVNTASTFNGAFTSSNLNLAGGVQTGNAAVLSGQAQWTAGALAGTWAVAPGATLTLQGAGGKSFNGSTFTNNGTVAWQASSSNLSVLSSTSIVNNGTWDAQGDTALVYGGGTASSFTNNGLLRKTGGSGTTSLTNSTSLGFVNNGTVDVQVGTIQLPGAFNNAGTLKGSGTFQSAGGITNSGTLAPGSFGTGTLALTGGNLTQAASAVFAVDLMSLSAFDLLTVAGSATLNGTLALNCLGACSFAVGDSLTILDATGSLTGSFSSVTLSGFASGAFNVVYDLPTASVRLSVTQAVTAVPEPGSWAMLLAGLGVMGVLARRRSDATPRAALS